MRKFVMFMVALGFLTGCGDYTGDSSSTYNESDYNIDNSTDNSENYICRDNNSTQCYTPDYSSYINSDGTVDEVADDPSGEYDDGYDASECAANGYFWCSIEQRCLNIPSDGGTCTQ